MINKLSIKNLNFGYHNKRIFSDFFMDVSDGQIVSIVGPNGSGKSTLIKCIDSILKPSSGDVTVDRDNIGDMDRVDIAKRIAYVPQGALRGFPNTVFDVVLMGRRPYLSWRGDKRDEEKVWEVLNLLGIEELAMNYYTELSGGQQQKVLIARALAQETGLILLDEPTSNLDVWHQIDVMEILRSLVRRERLTTIIAIHDLNMAARFSDKIMMMKKGRIIASGAPNDVMTAKNLETVYGIKANIRFAEDVPFIIPMARIAARA
jgi:iron complex transport system ATP-binding protein